VSAIAGTALVLAIVLPLSMNSSEGGHRSPFQTAYNPYKVNQEDIITNDAHAFHAVLRAPHRYNKHHHLSAIDKVIPTHEDGTKKLTVNTQSIPEGPNNIFASNIKFEMEMINKGVAQFLLTDNDKPRYSIPEVAVKKPKSDNTQTLESLGFNYELDPFSFTMSDPQDSNRVLVSTHD